MGNNFITDATIKTGGDGLIGSWGTVNYAYTVDTAANRKFVESCTASTLRPTRPTSRAKPLVCRPCSQRWPKPTASSRRRSPRRWGGSR